ncbi:AMP-binding protein [Elongatibacter sediminis]|uniref:AMP-binding protein n=1 Tax=Elongatibacter sediminis TaxID=3119006 RepID=A0AAW9RIP6_9GAMM
MTGQPGRLSQAKGSTDAPLLESTIGHVLNEAVSAYPDNDALVSLHQGLRYSYREFAAEVDRCARALIAIGLQPGDRVGIWSPNRAEWTILQFATSKLGVILVNINPSYQRDELEYALGASGCAALVLAPGLKHSDYLQILRAIAPELDACESGRLRCQALPALRTVIRLGDEPADGVWRWADFLQFADAAGAADLARIEQGVAAGDAVNIQYTSGTTGRPKGATLSHRNILNNAFFVAELMHFTERDRLVIPVPLYHCFGMVMSNLACVSHGATMILPSESFDPGAVLAAVAAERATALHGVPTMFIAELEHPEFDRFDLSTLRTGIMAGSTCPEEVMRAVMKKMHLEEMQIAYGMTETSPVSTQTRADAPLEMRVATVGQVHPHVEIKIIDPDTGQTVEREVAGEFCTRGYNVMLGYWNDEAQTSAAIDEDGWMHTGDLASMDDEGYVRIVGRIKDMIIRGGENIYPREIEEFLYTHPKIREVQVIGVPDARYGEEVMAWIALSQGESATVEEIQSFCRERIAYYKVPRFIKFVDDFPMTVTGKIQKFIMREQSIRELAGQ